MTSLRARLRKLESLINGLLSAAASNPTTSQPWTVVTSGATNIPSGSVKVLADATNGNVVLSFAGPNAPPDQAIVLIKDQKGQSQVHPITLNAPSVSGWTIEQAQNPGNLGAASNMTSQGGAWTYQVDAANKTLRLIGTA